jgi:ABC-type transport system substrate-binding protein
MTSLSRTAPLLAARIGLAVVALSLALFGAWTVGDLFGQAPNQKNARGEEEEDPPKAKQPAKKKQRVEEEEETAPKKPKRKVIKVEEEEPPKGKATPGRPAVPSGSGNLAQLEEQATHEAVKTLFHSLKVPHDRVLYKLTNVTQGGERRQREELVEPISFNLGSDPGRYHRESLKFTELTTDKFERLRSHPANLSSIESVRPYEQIAQDKVRDFLREKFDEKDKDDRFYLSRYDMLDAADKVLMAVLNWHESARQTGKRKGEEWNEVEKRLREFLLDEVRLKQMGLHAQSKDWDRVLEMTRRLAADYTGERERERILRPIASMIDFAINRDPTASDKTKQDACMRLQELDREFPNNPTLRSLKEVQQKLAKSYLEAAKKALSDKREKAANEYLLKAEMAYPQMGELQAFRSKLDRQHPTLRVGVRGPLPKYFSPAWACTDNERRAVDMLFESLVKLIPDKSGGFRYHRGLSESPPKVVSMGRQFRLPPEARWSDHRPLNSTDIGSSWELLQRGLGVGRSHVWGDLLNGVKSDNDPYLITLRMKQGFLDPLTLMTFKIVPRDLHVNEEEFALNPVTSGPFLLDRSQRSDEMQRECVFFLANPEYRARPSKRDVPHILEIRFYSYDSNKIAEDLGLGKLDLVLDLTAKEAAELQQKESKGELPIGVPLPSPGAVNRRIYFLAVNTGKLGDAALRQALSCAIDRESLLNKHFRASFKAPLHKALCGPFPAGSWASKVGRVNGDDKASPPLFDKEKAALLAAQPAVREAGPLKLKYPDDKPDVAAAMKELSEQVTKLTGLKLELEPVSPYKLRLDVEMTRNYDLAYYHYDFPDQCFWLAPLFEPPPGVEGGKNMFKFQNAELTNLLEGAKSYRDFAKVKEYQQQTQVWLNKQMPFIPLWQLDPLLAYRTDVRPVGLDPLWVFCNIEEWSLVRK